MKQIALEDDNAKLKVNIWYQVLFENHILINDVTTKNVLYEGVLTKSCKAISKSMQMSQRYGRIRKRYWALCVECRTPGFYRNHRDNRQQSLQLIATNN